MPPPTFPPPPPPPLEDIPQRSPAPVTRQRSFGPSVRGNYAEADFRGGTYPEDFRRMQQQSGPGGAYTGEEKRETPLENPYMVQTALGAAYSMGEFFKCPAGRVAMLAKIYKSKTGYRSERGQGCSI